MTIHTPNRTQAERADLTRARILDAAVRQFSANGLAGARTEQIAEEACVNKALLYYYFSSKQAIYDAALEAMANGVLASSLAAMDAGLTAGERLLQFVLNHFDRIHSQQAFQSLMHQEMIRLHRGEDNALAPLVNKVFRPMMVRVRSAIAEGRNSGELIQVDELQIMYAALGANAFYYLSAPIMGLTMGTDPLERNALEHRRKVAIEYLGQTIFTNRAHGALVAARVLASSPMPPTTKSEPRAYQANMTRIGDSATAVPNTEQVRHK